MQQHIQHVDLWAHARRYFVDVAKTTKKPGLAQQAITYIGTLYQLEKSLKETNAQASIFITRNQKAKPIVDELKELLDQSTLKVLPISPLGQAVCYALTHWETLKSYLYDGRLEIDNNLSERAIKPFVIGRKNWLFHGNDIGACAGSVLYPLNETCKNHKVDISTHIQQAYTMAQMEALLPYNINTSLLADLRSIPHSRFPE